MRIAELDVSGYIEFEGTNYRYWEFEVDDIVVKVAEFALQKALLPDFPETKYKNFTAESLDHQISYYAMDDESVEDIKSVISGEK
jgi:hypothetical protein